MGRNVRSKVPSKKKCWFFTNKKYTKRAPHRLLAPPKYMTICMRSTPFTLLLTQRVYYQLKWNWLYLLMNDFVTPPWNITKVQRHISNDRTFRHHVTLPEVATIGSFRFFFLISLLLDEIECKSHYYTMHIWYFNEKKIYIVIYK